MAAIAHVIVMNATFMVAADAVPFIWTDSVHLTLTFCIDSKIEMFLWQKLELLRVHYDNPLFVFCFFLYHAKLTVDRIKRPTLLI